MTFLLGAVVALLSSGAAEAQQPPQNRPFRVNPMTFRGWRTFDDYNAPWNFVSTPAGVSYLTSAPYVTAPVYTPGYGTMGYGPYANYGYGAAAFGYPGYTTTTAVTSAYPSAVSRPYAYPTYTFTYGTYQPSQPIPSNYSGAGTYYGTTPP